MTLVLVKSKTIKFIVTISLNLFLGKKRHRPRILISALCFRSLQNAQVNLRRYDFQDSN